MEKGAYKWYKDLPPWAKGVVVVGGLTGAFFGGRAVYHLISNAIDKAQKGQALKDVKSDLNNLMLQGIFPSYNDSQYKTWADGMEACYQGWGTCTGDTIFVNMKNDADVLKLIEAFGVRTISSGRWNPAPDFTGDLPAVLRDELTGTDIESINNALGDKKIKFRF